MSLSDTIGSLNLGVWAIVALLIFLGVFLAITWRVVRQYPKTRAHAIANLVLEDTARSKKEGES